MVDWSNGTREKGDKMANICDGSQSNNDNGQCLIRLNGIIRFLFLFPIVKVKSIFVSFEYQNIRIRITGFISSNKTSL